MWPKEMMSRGGRYGTKFTQTLECKDFTDIKTLQDKISCRVQLSRSRNSSFHYRIIGKSRIVYGKGWGRVEGGGGDPRVFLSYNINPAYIYDNVESHILFLTVYTIFKNDYNFYIVHVD